MEKLSNVIFYNDKGDKFELSEIEGKDYFKKAYKMINTLVYSFIEEINSSEAVVIIDMTQDRDKMFQIKEVPQELSDKLAKISGVNIVH